MLLYGVGRTSFTPQIRRHSSAGQSARFTSVRSWVQVPLSPPRRSKVRFAPASFFACGRKEAIRPLPCSSFSAKGHARLACSVASALATAHSRYHPFAGVAIQTNRLPKKGARLGAFFFWCKGRASLRRKLVSLPELCSGNASFPHTRPLPHVGAKSALLRLLFLPAAEKKPSARSLAPPFPQKGTLGSPARL